MRAPAQAAAWWPRCRGGAPACSADAAASRGPGGREKLAAAAPGQAIGPGAAESGGGKPAQCGAVRAASARPAFTKCQGQETRRPRRPGRADREPPAEQRTPLRRTAPRRHTDRKRRKLRPRLFASFCPQAQRASLVRAGKSSGEDVQSRARPTRTRACNPTTATVRSACGPPGRPSRQADRLPTRPSAGARSPASLPCAPRALTLPVMLAVPRQRGGAGAN